ncbi:MAG TPA: DNA polymerase III subunit delta' [Gammaproteobacteria bacterium]|nr:DNA polymerase III subunit delta' [Gammaproteobacteria bacterium]
MIYPWQTAVWSRLLHLKDEKKLAHALLFNGVAGIGKVHFADELVKGFFCRDKVSAVEKGKLHKESACHACSLLTGRVHPNVRWIEPEKNGDAIKIDQIREVIAFLSHTSLQGELRIALLHPAEAMNSNAANALLKTLEEPASGAMLILISHRPGLLPATVRSRCQRVDFALPSQHQAEVWLGEQRVKQPQELSAALKLAHGAPLTALAYLKEKQLVLRKTIFEDLHRVMLGKADPLQIAAQKSDVETLTYIDLSLAWIMDVLRMQLSGSDSLTNINMVSALEEIKEGSDMQKNISLMTYLHSLRCQLLAGFNLNNQLVLENILIRFKECGVSCS